MQSIIAEEGELNQTCCFKHTAGHQIKLFPPHIGFSSMDESVWIHMEFLIWYQQDMKEKIARNVHTADLAASANPVCYPTLCCPPRLMGTWQSPDVLLQSRQLYMQGCSSHVAPAHALTCSSGCCGLVSHVLAPTLLVLDTICCSSISNSRQEQGRGQRTFQRILERNAYLSQEGLFIRETVNCDLFWRRQWRCQQRCNSEHGCPFSSTCPPSPLPGQLIQTLVISSVFSFFSEALLLCYHS